MSDIDEAKALLEASGYVVLKAKSYRQATERQRVAEALRRSEQEAAQHARAWALQCLNGERSLARRCEFLYGVARAHGATVEELRGDA